MKAKYAKPLLAVEVFSLAQSTARDCGDSIPDSQLTSNDPYACVWDLGGGTTVFVVGHNCEIDGINMGYYCYNNPSEENFAFRS